MRRASRSSPRTPPCASPATGATGQDQHRRHPRPRRLRRRGRAGADDGRRRAAAGRRLRGPAAADPLRAAQGARARTCRSSWWSTRSTAPTPASTRWSTRSRTLFLDLDADIDQIDFPVVYLQRPRGPGEHDHARSHRRAGTDLKLLFELLVEHLPAPTHDPDHPLQALVTNLDASPYVGPPGHVPHPARHDPQGPAGGLVPVRRHHRAGQGGGALRHRDPRARRGRRGRTGRDHRGRRP